MELNILKVLNSISPLTEQDCAELLKIFKTVVLKKGEMWLEQGKVNYNGAFVEEGYLRRFGLKMARRSPMFSILRMIFVPTRAPSSAR